MVIYHRDREKRTTTVIITTPALEWIKVLADLAVLLAGYMLS